MDRPPENRPQSRPTQRGISQFIEPLEPRIAPAAVTILSPHKAIYTDVDGDHVTVAVTAGTLVSGDFTTVAGGVGLQLQQLNLSDPGFYGANVSITATKVPGGDGLVNIGDLNGGANNFGAITVGGDLAELEAGINPNPAAAIAVLSANSLGNYGTTTGGDLSFAIFGKLGALNVAHDVVDAAIQVSGTTGSIGSVRIGGSLIGDSGTYSGAIASSNNIGNVIIGKNIQGGVTPDSGMIYSSGGAIGSVTVGGSILGGPADYSGCIFALSGLGPVHIGHSLVGGSGLLSGSVSAGYNGLPETGSVASVQLGGGLLGGAGIGSGGVYAGDLVGPVKIAGSVIGGSGNYSASLYANAGYFGTIAIAGSLVGGDGDFTGIVYGVTGNISATTIGGSMVGGDGQYSGAILSQTSGNLVSLKVAGNVIGGYGNNSASVFIATGSVSGPIKIGGNITGGYGTYSARLYAKDNLSAVTVTGDLLGGYGMGSGLIQAAGLGSAAIGGDVIGGFGEFSGSFNTSSTAGPVKIGGSLQGGSGAESGAVYAALSSLTTVAIGGNVIGGDGQNSGLIFSGANLQSVTIGGDLIGGSATGTASISDSGTIWVEDHLGSVLVKGSVISGSNSGTGTIGLSGAIFSDAADIGSITVLHDIVGNFTSPVQISAVGQLVPPSTGKDVAIGSLTVDGSVTHLDLFAGFVGSTVADANANAVISSITVKGNWRASSAVAGAHIASPPNVGVGDSLQTGGNPSLMAGIGAITIGGTVSGTAATGDSFGFVSQTFGTITIGGHAIALTPGVIPQALTGDVYLELI